MESVAQAIGNVAMQFGDDANKGGMSRPFGVALLFAGIDEKGPRLYESLSNCLFTVTNHCIWCRFSIDPSGTFLQYDAKAIGKLHFSNPVKCTNFQSRIEYIKQKKGNT